MHKIVVALIFLSFSSLCADFEYKPANRQLTLSLGYLERVFNSNQALVNFPVSVVDSYGALFEVATASINKQWWSRLIISIAELPVAYWISNSIFVPYHEFGHARFYHASGRDYLYTTAGYGKRLSGISNYWILSAGRLITPPFFFPGSGNASARAIGDASVNSSLLNYWGQNAVSIISSASGLNNQTFLAKTLAQEIYRRDGHITQTSHYLINKVSGFGYSLLDRKSTSLIAEISDVGSLLERYQAKGYGIKHRDLELQSLVSVLSGTTYALLRGYYNYLAHGDARVYPAELFGIRIPDINSYINARGLSFEFVSGYRVNRALFFDLAYEFIWKGDSAHQVTPSGHFDVASIAPSVDSLWLNADVVIGNGLGFGFGTEWMPRFADLGFWNHFSYFADLTLYNAFNLYGERNITSLRNGRTMSLSALGGLRLNY